MCIQLIIYDCILFGEKVRRLLGLGEGVLLRGGLARGIVLVLVLLLLVVVVVVVVMLSLFVLLLALLLLLLVVVVVVPIVIILILRSNTSNQALHRLALAAMWQGTV